VKDLSVGMKKQKQLELNSKGIHQADIARILKISEPTILRDLYYLKQEAKQTIQNYIDDRLPYEYRKCLEGLDAILRMAWSISSQQNIDSRKYRLYLWLKNVTAKN